MVTIQRFDGKLLVEIGNIFEYNSSIEFHPVVAFIP